ncbi:hypothetical protein PHO31112_02618 [Pandoraea horticolens]|uniref:Bacteriocin n=1 Tax=Pandoraea horticolens TaxID=2508298 RepID=A0A5E4VFF7_9BURK|nr:hypothetical protein [Pandoraea horticolens]VVE10836.1 hypothetical protein PHO31112_02618 [Pandoraea horticolens]
MRTLSLHEVELVSGAGVTDFIDEGMVSGAMMGGGIASFVGLGIGGPIGAVAGLAVGAAIGSAAGTVIGGAIGGVVSLFE